MTAHYHPGPTAHHQILAGIIESARKGLSPLLALSQFPQKTSASLRALRGSAVWFAVAVTS
jgi:hypothetical protein